MRPAPLALVTGVVTGLSGVALLSGGGAIAGVVLAAAQATFLILAIACYRRPAS